MKIIFQHSFEAHFNNYFLFGNFFFCFQNTPLHLAATHGHPAVLNYLLSNPKAHIVKNSSHENILDIAARSEQREVAAVIAKHERSVLLKS